MRGNIVRQIVDKIRRGVRRIANFGLTTNCSETLSERVRLTNLIAFGFACIVLAYSVLFFSMNLPVLGWLATPFIAAYLFVLVLNKFKTYLSARVLLIFVFATVTYVFSSSMGRDSEVHYWYIPAMFTPFLIFSLREKVYLIGSAFGAFSGLWFLKATHFQYPVAHVEISSQQASFLSLYMIGGAFFTAFSLVFALVLQLEKALLKSQKSEKSLNESENYLRVVLNSIQQGVWGLDTEGRATFINDTAVRLLGYTSAREILGKHMHSLVHHSFDDGRPYPQRECPMYDSFRNGKTHHIRNEALWRKDGSHFPISYYSAPIIVEDYCIGSVISFEDLTEQIRLQKVVAFEQRRSETLFRSLFDDSPIGIIVVDRDYRYQMANQTFQSMTGYSLDELKSRTMFDITFSEDLETDGAELGTLFTGTGSLRRIPGKFVKKDGSVRWFLITSGNIMVPGEEDFRLVSTVEDITESKRIRDELIRANEEARSAVRSKAEFLANISHEIRTPMNGVIGMTNLLLADPLTSEQSERLKIVQHCGNSLLDLINDVLDFSKIEAGKIELENEPFAVRKTTSEIVELFKGRASERGVTLSYAPESSTPNWILGDSTRFRQVLSNLVSNAIKFTENGRVEIQSFAKPVPGQKTELQFLVKDSGVGIPENIKSKLFVSFSQADASTTRKFGGTGLGLAISKGLCEKMGGTIWVESEPGQGSTFKFTLVAKECEAQPGDDSINPFTNIDPHLAKNNPLQILIVEDNRTNQIVATGLLGKLGYRADVAGNGREALECLAQKKYDLILMDCHMPVMDGFEATKRIVAQFGERPRPRIVALTASMMKEDIENCFRCGMDGFIGKPVTLPALVKALTEDGSTRIKQEAIIRMKVMDGPTMRSYDKKAFLVSFEGMEALAKETVQSFLAILPILVATIEIAVRSRNAADLEQAAHSLKGSVSNFYAEPSRLLLWQLEQLGHGMVTPQADDVFEELKLELERLSADLKKFSIESSVA